MMRFFKTWNFFVKFKNKKVKIYRLFIFGVHLPHIHTGRLIHYAYHTCLIYKFHCKMIWYEFNLMEIS